MDGRALFDLFSMKLSAGYPMQRKDKATDAGGAAAEGCGSPPP